jgi:hypothetical protein
MGMTDMRKIKPSGKLKIDRPQPSAHHATTTVSINGWVVPVDKAILELIVLMNTVPGVETLACCQGYPLAQAYVSFMGPGSFEFLATIVSFLARTFAVHGTEVDVGDGTHYWHGLSIQVDEHFCMRWQQQTYPLILAAAREAASTITASVAHSHALLNQRHSGGAEHERALSTTSGQ